MGRIPAHIPAECVVDFDLYQVGADGRDYFETWLSLRRPDGPDILWSPHHGGHWIVTRGADIHRLIADADLLSNAILTAPTDLSEIARLIPLQADPPEHAAYRAPVAQAFRAKFIFALEPEIRALCRSLIAETRGRGACEFVTEIAEIIPIRMFLTLVGLPVEDRAMLRQFGEQLNRPDGTMTAEQLLDRMSEYLHPYVVERLAHPGEDLFSRILAAPVGDRRWTENEAMRMCRNLLLGGLDTVAAMFGFVMHHLARHAAHRALLHDQPDLVPQAADEFLRRFGSVLLGRVAIEDFRVGAVAVKAGDVVLLPTALHNLDARSFDAPLAVDFQRGMVAHSTMGNGAHRCVGAGLARLELVTFLEEWLDAIPEFTIDPARPVRMRGGGVGSLQALPLVWPAGYQGN